MTGAKIFDGCMLLAAFTYGCVRTVNYTYTSNDVVYHEQSRLLGGIMYAGIYNNLLLVVPWYGYHWYHNKKEIEI